MYLQFFQLREMPFSITPDPAYLYMSPRHQEALGHLLYGTGQYGGFVQLTGEVGTGKTTIVRALLDQKLENVDVALIHNPRLSEQEFVQTLCDELGVQYARDPLSLKTLIDALNEHLLRNHAAGRRTVVIIDEAQNLQPAVLEQVRLLTNLETEKEKLLRIMLIGQQELSALLARSDMRQLASRITARYHLTPLGARETAEYIEHRLRIAGAQGEIFTPAAMAAVRRYSGGIPRLINIICDRALLGAYAQNARRVSPQIVRRSAHEAVGQLPDVFDPRAKHRWRLIELGWAAALLICLGLLVWSFTRHDEVETPAAPVAAAAVTHTAAAPASPVATPAAAPAIPEPPPVQADLPADIEMLEKTSEPLGTVTGRLVQLWNPDLTIDDGRKLCSSIRKYKLECLRDKGHWNDLLLLNRPAILRLDLPKLGAQYFLLTAMNDKDASFSTAMGPVRIAREIIEASWSGDFLMLWRPEIGEARIDEKSRGAPVAWLWKRLAELKLAKLPSPMPKRYTPELASAVRQFQTERGMKVDGVVGKRTLVVLGERQPDTPTLHSVTQP